MKRLALFGSLALAVLSSSALGNLGESKTQIEQRWGVPIQIRGYPDERAYTYRAGQFRVCVGYLDGLSQSEQYWRLDKTSFSPSEREQLFAANSLGKTWLQKDDHYELVDESASAHSDEIGKSFYFYTAQSSAASDQKKPSVRTGKQITFSGSMVSRKVANEQWLVVHSGPYVLEIPWTVAKVRAAPAELTSGQTYSFPLLDEEALDSYARVACLSDREHKDWKDVVYDSKFYLLARLERGNETFFDRSVCEVHHVKMKAKMVDVEYGMIAVDECERIYPHHRDHILGGCIGGPEKKGLLFICPLCVASCRARSFLGAALDSAREAGNFLRLNHDERNQNSDAR